jgi:hypothetical protein
VFQLEVFFNDICELDAPRHTKEGGGYFFCDFGVCKWLAINGIEGSKSSKTTSSSRQVHVKFTKEFEQAFVRSTW